MKTEIVAVNKQNLSDHPGVICFINPKHPSYSLKAEWLKERFSEGLQIKLLNIGGQKKAAGFIEYVPGEFAWRAVAAKAQQAPSFYGIFNFIRDGKVLADRYISLTRFKNILKHEKLI